MIISLSMSITHAYFLSRVFLDDIIIFIPIRILALLLIQERLLFLILAEIATTILSDCPHIPIIMLVVLLLSVLSTRFKIAVILLLFSGVNHSAMLIRVAFSILIVFWVLLLLIFAKVLSLIVWRVVLAMEVAWLFLVMGRVFVIIILSLRPLIVVILVTSCIALIILILELISTAAIVLILISAAGVMRVFLVWLSAIIV